MPLKTFPSIIFEISASLTLHSNFTSCQSHCLQTVRRVVNAQPSVELLLQSSRRTSHNNRHWSAPTSPSLLSTARALGGFAAIFYTFILTPGRPCLSVAAVLRLMLTPNDHRHPTLMSDLIFPNLSLNTTDVKSSFLT